MNAILDELAGRFGITPAQAESAAGAIFKFVQQEAASGDFQKLLAAVPQLQTWIAKAGHADGAGGGGLLGSLGGLVGEGGIGALLASLQKSGLGVEGAAQFLPALVQQLSSHVDPALLAKVLESVPALKELGQAQGGGLGSLLGGLLGGR
ncbi:MAG: DUF2780 domain-containing protein [Solimonas sp.]